MSFYDSVLRPLAFRVDPERIHNTALGMIARGWVSARTFDDPRLQQTLAGIQFPNPLGLAAGFDKNGVAIPHWQRLGFGFAELGTVTFHAQPGNDKPRMFRIPEAKGLINRLGFNNRGAEHLAHQMASHRATIPLGINLGKSKITELKDAPLDYQNSYRLLHTFGDYFVINVSSPNTPGLRQLQDRSALEDIIAALREVDATRPLFVKIAPDLEDGAIDDVMQLAGDVGLTGIIATNTTISRAMLRQDPRQPGGLSGLPLQQRANEVLRRLAERGPRNLVLIGVGGIMNGDDLYEKIALGAHICQVYTGWIYGGPGFVPHCLRQLIQRMESESINSIIQLHRSGLPL